jgi:hypothetical protein
MNKAMEFILAKMPEVQKQAVAKIKELAKSGIEKGEEKKDELDKFIINFLDSAIDAYDMPMLPDAIIDPSIKKLVALYVPQITQAIFDTLEDKLD